MKRQIKELIDKRGLRNFASVSPRCSIFQALNTLDISNQSALLVVDNNVMQGIFSEKDFARACISKGIRFYDSVDKIMTKKVYYAEATFKLEECLQIMTKAHVRHLPILEASRPIALVSMRHIVEILVADKEDQIRELTNYITGGQVDTFSDLQSGTQKPIPVFSYESTNRQELL